MNHTRIIVTHYGGPDELRVVDEECPEPKAGEVRVRILAAGVALERGSAERPLGTRGRPSAAVNNLSETREFRERYEDLLKHYGLEAQRINVRQPHENGDAESSHGHVKEVVEQALRLRGSRDFASREEYVRFLADLVASRNANRQRRFAEELALLRPLPARHL